MAERGSGGRRGRSRREASGQSGGGSADPASAHGNASSGDAAPSPTPEPVRSTAPDGDRASLMELPQSTPPGSAQPSGSRRREDAGTGFEPLILDRTVIAIPLLATLRAEREAPGAAPTPHAVIIDVNLEYKGGRVEAQRRVRELIAAAIAEVGTDKDPQCQGVHERKSQYSQQYVFARLEGEVIRELVRRDGAQRSADPAGGTTSNLSDRAIYRIWPDFPVNALTTRSVKTVKADAARIAYSALGEDVVWAVLDSGIQGDHPHFQRHANLKHESPLKHRDFTSLGEGDGEDEALRDQFGHGTHVAGILAGEQVVPDGAGGSGAGGAGGGRRAASRAARGGANADAGSQPGIRAFTRFRDEHGDVKYERLKLREISGMAPKTKLLSLKVLDENGEGDASNLIAALEYVQELNGYGRRLRIHGINMSVGYQFKPEWFACGQSPLCVEVDRLVRSGVVVVVAAGNTGYGWVASEARGSVPAGMDLTINDPGNAELAITVGATHRDMPHVYGVSYFSSKGPTGDGRLKPDLVAPGEKILSCGAGRKLQEAQGAIGEACDYIEDSGTSMAAPHVAGVIAAFLSIRREFIGQPERVKEIFLSTCTDLKRDRSFQGRGLVDLIRAIQSV